MARQRRGGETGRVLRAGLYSSAGSNLFLAQFGIEHVAKRVAEEIEPEYSQGNCEAGKYRYPRRALGVFLGTTLEHETPSRYWLLHTQAKK